jgi:transposase
MTDEKSRHRYDEAFKRHAVQMLIESGKPVTTMALSMGVDRSNLQKWKKKFGYEFISVAKGPSGKSVGINEFISLKKEIASIKDTVQQLRSIMQTSFERKYLNGE